MIKKVLGTLLIGAFVFGIGAVDLQVANAASPFRKPSYSQYKPEKPRNDQRERERNRHGGRTQRFR